eukprot:scaffold122931_cov19-Tisochrysis_lutea.AAC.1
MAKLPWMCFVNTFFLLAHVSDRGGDRGLHHPCLTPLPTSCVAAVCRAKKKLGALQAKAADSSIFPGPAAQPPPQQQQQQQQQRRSLESPTHKQAHGSVNVERSSFSSPTQQQQQQQQTPGNAQEGDDVPRASPFSPLHQHSLKSGTHRPGSIWGNSSNSYQNSQPPRATIVAGVQQQQQQQHTALSNVPPYGFAASRYSHPEPSSSSSSAPGALPTRSSHSSSVTGALPTRSSHSGSHNSVDPLMGGSLQSGGASRGPV